jgi:hypothetical protein
MTKNKILKAFKALDKLLESKKLKGEIGVVGGAAMVLGFDSRAATKDVDAIFVPSKEIRAAAKAVAQDQDLPEDWLNDAVKGYLPGEPESKEIIYRGNGLTVWLPPAEYLLAMKSISARYDTQDAKDVKTLCEFLKIKNPKKVFDIVSRYYPENRIPAKTRFFIEEILG